MLTPNKAPPIAEKMSPNVGAVKNAEKSQPWPHKIKQPNKQLIAETTPVTLGLLRTRMNMVMGTATTENDSKKVFLDKLVDSKPIN